MGQVEVILVSSNQLFRDGLATLPELSQFRPAIQASSLDEVMRQSERASQAALMIVDFQDPCDIAALQRFRQALPQVKMAILAGTADHLAACCGAGADGYLLTTISPEALAASLELILLGEKVFPSGMAALLARSLVHAPAAQSADPDAVNGLSGRESQILRRLLAGDQNKAIARHLGITEATVKVHLKGALKKIGAINRTQAAIWAMSNGLRV